MSIFLYLYARHVRIHVDRWILARCYLLIETRNPRIRIFGRKYTCLVVGESSLLPRLASALRASRGPISVLAIADSLLWRSCAVVEGVVEVVVPDGCASVSDSSSVSDSVSSEELLVSSSSSSSSSFFFMAVSSRAAGGGCVGGGGAARLPTEICENPVHVQINIKRSSAFRFPGEITFSRNVVWIGRGFVNDVRGIIIMTLRFGSLNVHLRNNRF